MTVVGGTRWTTFEEFFATYTSPLSKFNEAFVRALRWLVACFIVQYQHVQVNELSSIKHLLHLESFAVDNPSSVYE